MTTSSLIELPLALDLRFPNHPPYFRDFSRLPCRSLARDLARALLARTAVLLSSPRGSFQGRWAAVSKSSLGS